MPGAIERLTSTQGIIGPRVRNALPQRQLPDRSELDDVVEHFWQTSWDFPPGRPHTTETLPFPCQHLTIERLDGVCSIRITGLYRRVWQRELSGEGEVFGIKFRPAGFHAALGLAPGEFTDRTADGAGIPFIYAKYGFGESEGRGRVTEYEDSAASIRELLDRCAE